MPAQAQLAPSMQLVSNVADDIKGMEAAALKALLPVMAQAQKELADDLAGWIAKLGPDAAKLKYTAAHIHHVQMVLGVAQQQAVYPKAAFGNVVAYAVNKTMAQQQAPQLAMATLQAKLDSLRTNFGALSTPQLTEAAWFARGDKLLLDGYKTSAARYAGQVKTDLRFQLGVGLAKGETLDQMVKRIANVSTFKTAIDASSPALAGNAMAAGLTQRYHHWAERLVRTELVHSYNWTANQAIDRLVKTDDRVEKRWDASLDKRVCKICSTLHDSKAKPGQPFPGGYMHPPAHPHCRCAVVAWIEDDWGDDNAPLPTLMTPDEVAAKEAAIQAAKDKADAEAKARAAAAAAKQAAAEKAAKDKADAEAKAALVAKQAAEAAAAKKAADELAAKLAQEAAFKKAAEEAAALAKAQAAAQAKAIEDAKKAAEALAAKQAAELAAQQAAAKAAAQALAKAQADAQAAVQAALEKASAEAAAAAIQASQKNKYAALVETPIAGPKGITVPAMYAESPQLPTFNLVGKKKGGAKLTGLGLVHVDKDTLAGHGAIYKWKGKEWVVQVAQWDHGYKMDYHGKDSEKNLWVINPSHPKWAGTPNSIHAQAKPSPVAPPPPPPAAPPPMAAKPIKDLVGHEWKANAATGKWDLYKDGKLASLGAPAQQANSPTLEHSYSHPKAILDKGLVPVADGVLAGHGMEFTLQADKTNWVKTKQDGKPFAAPVATPTTSKYDYPGASTPAPKAPARPAWSPTPINLDPKRPDTVDWAAKGKAKAVFSGMHGHAANMDGDAIEGNSVRVVKVKGKDGEDYYEALFKVTAPYGQAAQAYGTDGRKDWAFNQRKLSAKGVLTDNGKVHTENIQTMHVTKTSPTGKHTLEVGTSGAVTNAVRIRASSLDELNTAMDSFSNHLGVDVRKTTARTDLELQAKARLASKWDPANFGERMSQARSPSDQRAVIEEIFAAQSAKHPILGKILADIQEVEVYPGHKTLYSKAMGEHFAKEFQHMYHTGSPPAAIAAKIVSDTGLMASTNRFHRGIFTTGMSTSRDFETGGADGVFIRARSHGQGGKETNDGSAIKVIMDTEKVLGRLDWYAFNFDNYGRAGYDSYSSRWAASGMKKGAENGGNEFMPSMGVQPSAIKVMICKDDSYRDTVLKELRDAGITQINGKPIEAMVVTRSWTAQD